MADMDEFAQTRGADDLFDDEIIPVSAEEQQVQTEVIVVPEPEPEPEPVPLQEKPQVEKQPSPRGEAPQRGRGGDRGRGRGRGNKGKGGRGLQESRWADPKPAESAPQNKASMSVAEPEISQDSTTEAPEKPREGDKTQSVQDDDNKSETANGAESQRVPAVRGDRSATGGIRKVSVTILSCIKGLR